MCGISCVVVRDEGHPGAHPKDKKQAIARLEESLEYIRHRGPDSTGTWISDNGRIGTPGINLISLILRKH